MNDLEVRYLAEMDQLHARLTQIMGASGDEPLIVICGSESRKLFLSGTNLTSREARSLLASVYREFEGDS